MKLARLLALAGLLGLAFAFAAVAQETTADPPHAKNISDGLIAQGPIGIVCLILLSAALVIYRDARSDRKEYDAKIAAKDDKLMAIYLEHAKATAAQTDLNKMIWSKITKEAS